MEVAAAQIDGDGLVSGDGVEHAERGDRSGAPVDRIAVRVGLFPQLVVVPCRVRPEFLDGELERPTDGVVDVDRRRSAGAMVSPMR